MEMEDKREIAIGPIFAQSAPMGEGGRPAFTDRDQEFSRIFDHVLRFCYLSRY